jgi:hypothetical protein
MQSADEALKEFDADGTAKTVEPEQNNTPSIKLHDADGNNIGLFVSGKLLGVREIKKNELRYMFVELKLESTNAKATIKRGSSYPEIAVKPGDIVSVYAASRLFNAVKNLPLGSRVFTKYEGIKKVETPRGKKDAHIFTVKSLPGQLTAEELTYVQRRKDKLTEKEAKTAQATVEAEAADALSTLED